MNKIIFETIEKPNKEQIALILDPLKKFNTAKVGPYENLEFIINAVDKKQDFLGGMFGRLGWGWLYIDLAFVKESNRHKGLGSMLLRKCEEFAVKNGVFNARANTGSFQAPQFYLKNGFEIFAKLDIVAPDGSKQIDYFLKKSLLANF